MPKINNMLLLNEGSGTLASYIFYITHNAHHYSKLVLQLTYSSTKALKFISNYVLEIPFV